MLGRAVLLGSISQQEGTEGSHSPAAHIPRIHSQPIPSLTLCLPHGLKGFSEVFSPLPPTFARLPTKSSCKCPLVLLSSSQAGIAKDHEPQQQPPGRGFAPHTHRNSQNITLLWQGLTSPRFARLSFARLSFASSSGMEDFDVTWSSRSTAPPGKCNLPAQF